MSTKLLVVVAPTLLSLALLAACGGNGDGTAGGGSTTHSTTDDHGEGMTGQTETEAGGGVGGREVSVQVAELNGSGQSGTATLTPLAGGTHVVVELRGGRAGPQSADIRKGTCDQPAARPQFPLQDLSGRRSETHLEVSLETLLTADYVILVQRSATEARAHAACAFLAAL